MKPLGINMQGAEAALYQFLTQKLFDYFDFYECFNYLEIGVAEGATFASIADALRLNKTNWRAIGIDIPSWVFKEDLVKTAFENDVHIIRQYESNMHLYKNFSSLILGDSKTVVPQIQYPIHLAFIDACHGKECVKTDFLNVENKVPLNGVVMFHDIADCIQGLHVQDFCCGDTIRVQEALRELGLWDNTRPGWNKVGIISTPISCCDIAVFRKIA